MVHLTVCSCHVTYTFQSESTLYSCLHVKELLALSWHKIWSLSDCKWTQTHDHLVLKRTLNCLAKLAKWLSSVASTYLYGALDCSSCHVCISEWIHILWLVIYSFACETKSWKFLFSERSFQLLVSQANFKLLVSQANFNWSNSMDKMKIFSDNLG